MFSLPRFYLLIASIGLFAFGVHSRAAVGQTNVRVSVESIAITGDAAPAPDGTTNGVFGDLFSFGQVSLNDAGQVSFVASGLDSTANGIDDNSGIFLGDDSGVTSIARRGQTVSGVGQFARNFPTLTASFTSLNESGQVAFRSSLEQFGNSAGVFLSDGTGLGITPIATTDQTFIDGVDTSTLSVASPVLNNAGQVVLGFGSQRLLIGSTTLSTNLIPTTLDSGQGLRSIFDLSLNDSGVAAFTASPTGSLSDRGIFISSTNSGLLPIAQDRQAAPDGQGGFDGVFSSFGQVSLNDADQVVFDTVVVDPVDFTSNEGIFLSDPTRGLSPIAFEGGAVPFSTNSTFTSFDSPTVNDSGQVAFIANTSDGESNSEAVIIFDSLTNEFVSVATRGDAAPDGDGEFNRFTSLFLNDAGQVLFRAGFRGSESNEGLVLFDQDLGLIQIARDDRELFGSSIRDFNFSPALNNSGQVAFNFNLEDRRAGVALVTVTAVPEPSGLSLLALGWAAVSIRRRKRAIKREQRRS